MRDQLDPLLHERILDPYNPVWITLEEAGASEQSEAEAVSGVMFGYFFGIMLGIAVFTSAGYLLQGVARDKSDRIVEILLSSVSARQLLAGKVLGLGALGLTQLAIWIGSLLLLGIVGISALGVAPAVFAFLFARPTFLLFDLLYFMLGFLLYALLMGSVGALGTTQQESQQMAGIFTFLAVIPFMLGGIFLSNPNALIVRILSWIPLTSPTAMLLGSPSPQNCLGSILSAASPCSSCHCSSSFGQVASFSAWACSFMDSAPALAACGRHCVRRKLYS